MEPHVVGRLATGASRSDARKEIDALYQAFAAEQDARRGLSDSSVTTVLMPLQRNIVGEVRRPLLILLGAIALVLLIACANLTNLLLARASSRTRELALRQCLGASALRIVRQTLTESLLLSFLGALLGVLVAIWIVTALKSFVASQIPNIELVSVDVTVLTLHNGRSCCSPVCCVALLLQYAAHE